MNQIRDLIGYILKHYPAKHELSNARVTKMVYLADWKHAFEKGSQITGIEWYFDNYGPFVWDVKNEAERHDSLFDIENVPNMYGSKKTLYKLKNKDFEPNLSNDVKKILDHVIEKTAPLYWDDFITLVYSTHPIMTSERYTSLDLVAKAKEYNEVNREARP